MSRYFPHTPYAEDQPLSHTILNVHVATRAITTGTIIGLAAGGIRHALASRKPAAATPTASSTVSSTSSAAGVGATATAAQAAKTAVLPRAPFLPNGALIASARGSLVTLALMAVATPLRMQGRDEIEWRDRSWRLMENEGQLETDDWTYVGMAVGAAAVGAQRRLLMATGWQGVVGGAGLGSLAGMIGYMTWRYGVNEGKFPVNKKQERAAF